MYDLSLCSYVKTTDPVVSVTSAADNGLNPVWLQKQFLLDVHNPTFSFLRFTVYEEDMFSDPNFLAQATLPVRLLRTGDPPSVREAAAAAAAAADAALTLLMCVCRLQKHPAEEQLQ